MKKIIDKAVKNGQKNLSEYESKLVIQSAGVGITREKLVNSKDDAVKVANEFGFPVVLKGSSPDMAHKTELDIIRLNIKDELGVKTAYDELMSKGLDFEGILVQEMVNGDREFVLGMTRDPQFGPTIMFGLGGIFTEILKDITFRIAPVSEFDAEAMISEINSKQLLEEFRGQVAVDKKLLKKYILGLSELALKNENIAEIDINPLKITGGKPVAVDALVILQN